MMRSVLLAAALFACAPKVQPGALEPVVTERLYFGRNIGNTVGVTDSAWAVFVRDIVGARLEGFTIWTAEGSWKGTREPSFVLEVVHAERSASADSAIVAIIGEYKRRFNQESVLRVVTNGGASY